MTTEKLRSYLFRTEAQWRACLFVETDRSISRDGAGLRPFRPWTSPPTVYPTIDACAPGITPTGEILWFDRTGDMHRLPADDDVPHTVSAPFPTTRAARVVATSRGLWVVGDPPASLQLYEETTLARLLTVDLDGLRPADLARDGRGAVWALVLRQEEWQAVRVDGAGHVGRVVPLAGLTHPVAFVFLSRTRRFVVLTAEPHPRLRWFDADGRALSSVSIGAMRPCFRADVLGTDGRDRVFIGGAEGNEPGGGAWVLTCDADGNRLGDIPLGANSPTGLAAVRNLLLITTERGLLRFAAGDVVPKGADEVRCMLLTPVLYSPDREDSRRWLRIEALASLPEGSTIELSYGATDDARTLDRLSRIAADESLPSSERVRRLLAEPDLWRWPPTVFHGTGAPPNGLAASFSAPLCDVRERYLWVCVTLTVAPGGGLPGVTELAVRYPGRSLMEELPAIYRRGEAEPGDFLRALVGVLEATTQGIDERIAAMGSLIHPSTAPAAWLDFVARWLGLPWDEALSLAQKKSIVARAADLARTRGTRAGLETLLETLMPGTPRRFRVTDTTADFGFATIGASRCPGSALPAMLGGRAPWSAELNAAAVLDAARLPCPGQSDDGASRLTGRIRVEVAATAGERRTWEPWLLTLITEMVPVTARLQLRWVAARALRGNRLDGTFTLEAAPAPHLGTDAVTGLARMPEGGNRLSAFGTAIGTRLG